jgi:outer membrane lipoprotein-sorting protein
MIRRTALMLGLAAALSPALPALAQSRALTPEEQQLIDAINAHTSAIRTMVAFRYAPPSREEIVSIGRGFYVIDRREETYYAYPQDSIPLRQFLGEQINLLNANVVDITTTDGYVSITVIDNTVAGTVQVSLIFDTDTKDLAQWTLVEPNGSELTFSLYDVQKDVEIPPNFFTFPATYTGKDPAS